MVLAGANAGAYIENVMAHSEDGEVEGIEASWGEGRMVVYETIETPIAHADGSNNETKPEDGKEKEAVADKTIEEIVNSMSDEQKEAMYAIVGMALEEAGENNEKGENEMKHNDFENAVIRSESG